MSPSGHIITITNSSVTASEHLIFNYINIGPGFVNETPIYIINNADSVAELRFTSVVTDPSDPNLLFPAIDLSLIDINGNLIMHSPVGRGDTDLLGTDFCVLPNTMAELTSRFVFPHRTGNEAQGATLAVIYSLQATVGTCDEDSIDVPGTGLNANNLSVTVSSVLGAVMLVSFIATVIFGVLFLNKRRRDKQECA